MAEFAWMWDGPYFVSEWSINGYWEVPKTAWEAPLENAGWKKQEELFRRYYENMPNDDPRFLGHCFFYWGHKQEVTATWFNAFTASGQPTYLYSAYALLNEDSHAYNPAPKVKYMLVNKGGGADHVILKPNEKYEAEIILDSPLDSTLKVNWSLCSEDWYSLELSSEAPPVAYLDHLLLKDEKVRIEFQAPEQEGPYRIYASLNYPGSITATVNTPIYVIE